MMTWWWSCRCGQLESGYPSKADAEGDANEHVRLSANWEPNRHLTEVQQRGEGAR